MIVGSLCSGISADSVAWHPLGWKHAWFSEIDKFCCAVLKHHYPEVPNYGDFTKHRDFAPIDLLMVSTPCQDFSVAGRRAGMGGKRGSLTLAAIQVLSATRPRWLVFENVPGLLQADCAVGFGEFLSRLADLGYGFGYRIYDAQYAGLAQRRERVFLVGYLGDWRPAAAVLLDLHSLQGHPAPRREAGEGFTHELAPSLTSSGRGVERTRESRGQDPVIAIGPLMANTHPGSYSGQDAYTGHIIAHALRADGFDASEDGTGRGTPLVPVHCFDARQNCVIQYGDKTGPLDTDPFTHALCFDTTQMTSKANRSNPKPGDPCHPLAAGAHPPAIAFSCKDHGADAGELAPTLRAMGHDGSHPNAGGQVAVASFTPELPQGYRVMNPNAPSETISCNPQGGMRVSPVFSGMAVRRLTARCCERLQGFPDDYTLIPEYRKRQKETGAAAEELLAYYHRTERGRAFVDMRDGRVYSTPDGPRYKALGNSIATPCLRYLGERIEMVESIMRVAV